MKKYSTIILVLAVFLTLFFSGQTVFAALAPIKTDAITNEDTQSTSGLVITATDGVTTHYKITNILNGSLFKNNGTTPINNGNYITKAEGLAGLKFTPSSNFHGTGSFYVQASENASGLNLSGEVKPYITVNPVNDAPVVTDIPDQTMDETNAVVTFTAINLDNYVSDHETSDTNIVWSYSGNSNLTVTINSSSVATITAPANWNGSETITFTATDTGDGASAALSASDAATFTVNSVNDAPVVTDIPDQTMDETDAVVTFSAINLDDYVSDHETSDTNIVWSYSGSTDLTVTINASHVATITAPANWNGSETITFTATDTGDGSSAALSASDAAIFTVNAVNDAPVVTDIPDQTVDETNAVVTFSAINLDNYVSDHETSDANIVWTHSGSTDLTVTINASRVATITAPADWNGSETITFTATDTGDGLSAALSASDAATFTVNAVNDAPELDDIPDQTMDETDAEVIFSAINLDEYIHDVETDEEDMVWTYSGNTNLTVTIDAARVATVTAPADWNGIETITFTATDTGDGTSPALSASDTAKFTVNSVSDSPEGADKTITILEDTRLEFRVIDFGYSDPVDAASNAGANNFNRLLVTTLPGNGTLKLDNADVAAGSYISVTDIAAKKITFDPAPGAHGTPYSSFTFQVEDDGADAVLDPDAKTMTVNVTAVNDMPSFTMGPDQTIDEDAGAQTVTGWATAIEDNDPEVEQTLTFNVTSDNNGLFSYQPSIDPSTGNLTYTPAADANGTATVTVTLTDDGSAGGPALTTEPQTFTITVNPVNDPPSFTKGADQTVLQGAGDQTVAGWATDISAGPANESTQTLTFTVTNDNSLIFSAEPAVDAIGTLTFTPAENASGEATVTVTLADSDTEGEALTATHTFTITVRAAPVIAVSQDEFEYEIYYDDRAAGNPENVTFTLTNDNSTGHSPADLHYTISESVDWLICSETGTLASGESTSITIQFDTRGLEVNTHEAYITVSDSNALNSPVRIFVRMAIFGIISKEVGGNTDDAEEEADGDVLLYNRSLSLGQNKVGIRFSGIGIPAGSKIQSAYITFEAFDDQNSGTALNIYGQNTGNASTFTGGNGNISDRTKTNKSVSWTPDTWSDGDLKNTPELKSIVQEIVNRSDWSSGNAIAIIIEGSGLRKPYSYDGKDGGWERVCENVWKCLQRYGRGECKTYGWGEECENVFVPGGAAPKLHIEYLPNAYPILAVDQTEFNLVVWEGENTDPVTFNVRNAGTGQMDYTITDTNTDDFDWITVSPSSGENLIISDNPQEITVNFDTDELTAIDSDPYYLEYTGAITITDPDGKALNSPAPIAVNLIVKKNMPIIILDTDYIPLTSFEGINASQKTFIISNTGRADLIYTLSETSDWMNCSPSGGTLSPGDSQTITVSFSSTSLTPGTYETTISIDSNDPDPSKPTGVTVSLTVEGIPLSTVCGDVPVYTENLVSPAILLLLDLSGSMTTQDIPVSETVPHQTPDIKTIVQEIVSRDNWASGNAMGFLFMIDSGSTGKRSASSYDHNSGVAPYLYVEYEHNGESSSFGVRVNSSNDDVEEKSDGKMDYTTSTGLEFGEKKIGIRFTNVQIPQGATITGANMFFNTRETNTYGTTKLKIYGWNVDNAPQFGGTRNYITNTEKTSVSASWVITEGWTQPTMYKRIDVAKEALLELVDDKTISWGFGTWHGSYPANENFTKIDIGCNYHNYKINPADTNEPTHLAKLKAKISAATTEQWTPFQPSLKAGLEYFVQEKKDETYDTFFERVDCQPVFLIDITDGLGNYGTDADKNYVANGSNVTTVGAATLALAEEDVNTVGIGFGLSQAEATQIYELARVANLKGDEYDDDDLYALHDVVNGVAQPFMAQTKEELVNALKTITSSIKAEVFHGSAPAPTTSVDYGDIVITAKFQPADWSGDLVATQYDNITGELTDELWSAADEMPDTIKAFTVMSGAAGSSAVAYTDATLATDSFICDDKKLGDIIDSTPIIVENPSYSYNFDNYMRGFKYAVERDPLVYIGANDGALHAFLLTDKKDADDNIIKNGGEEVWRFYPKEVHDKLNYAKTEDNWDMCAGDYCHRYFVDGSPIAADIYDPDDTDGATWKTMLVTGLREGGEAYFALDISYGNSFDAETNPSEFMWEFTDTELGQTWAEPAISRVAKFGGGTAWSVFFGSGYKELPSDQANKEAYVYGIEAHNMADLWVDSGNNPTNRIKISSTTLTDDALSPPLSADNEGDFKADVLYTGNLYGNMYRVKDIGKGMMPVISKLYDSENTDHSQPIRAKADYGYTEESGVIRVYFGTGRYETQIDKYTSNQQYFFSLKDDGTSGYNTPDDEDLAKLAAGYITDSVTGISYRNITGTNDDNDSWVIGLDHPGITGSPLTLASERVISQPLVVAGVVFFTTFIPDEDVCAGSGDAWLFAVDYESGLPPDEPVFDLNGDGVVNEMDVVTIGENKYVPAGIPLSAGQPSKPVLHKDTMFVTTTGGGLASLKVNLEQQLTNVTSWRDTEEP